MTRFRLPAALSALAIIWFAGPGLAREITVSAAASLTDAFTDMARNYEARHAGSRVLLNFGASGALLQQIVKGAPVDVFASADQETMDQAEKQGMIKPAERRNFAGNSLVVVVPKDSRLALKRLQDLTTVRQVAIGNPLSVPIGRYARHALEKGKLWPVVSKKAILTQNVRQSLDYVARGEVDAGFVYATDAHAMRDRVKIAFTVPLDIAIRYPIAPVNPGAPEAKRFIDFVLSPAGQAILTQQGFQKP